MNATEIAVVVLTASALETGRTIAGRLPNARVHGLEDRVDDADVMFRDTGRHLTELFSEGTGIVGVCAAGILIRTLAPTLAGKHYEPPVLAVAEDGSAVVPLLGGHHGANDLARTIAEHLKVDAAVTTAGDLRFGVALDQPPPGYVLDGPEHAKAFMAALLAGQSVRLESPTDWLSQSDLPVAEDGALTIRIDAAGPGSDATTLVYRPQNLAVGVGCERNTPDAQVIGLVMETLAEYGLSPLSVAAIVSIDLKEDEPAVHAVADALGVPVRVFGADRLEAETPRLHTPSEQVFREVGCHGVAEGAALAAVGASGKLIVPKQKSARATCAIALAEHLLDPGQFGRARGRVAIIGIGPGDDAWRTPQADACIGHADHVVGYGLYLDLLGSAIDGKQRHDFPLGAEEDRVRAALNIAADGNSVALVSSGDAGIYGMATLLFELLDKGDTPAWKRVDVAVAPGLSALQAAAARTGAPLGHDFCTISLSDLLTPWPSIQKRVKAAAEGDFVIAFYNPVSRRRTTQLAHARDVLLEHRPADTPVALARNLGRDGELVRFVTLSELDPADIDMLTVVLVGSSETRLFATPDGRQWMYTPRGYAGKLDSVMQDLSA